MFSSCHPEARNRTIGWSFDTIINLRMFNSVYWSIYKAFPLTMFTGFQSPSGDSAIVVPYPDSRSTSSGTSDMSDYIETLSLSSHSSSDVPDSLRSVQIKVIKRC